MAKTAGFYESFNIFMNPYTSEKSVCMCVCV